MATEKDKFKTKQSDPNTMTKVGITEAYYLLAVVVLILAIVFFLN